VDNITHAFVGAAMAECALPQQSSRPTRAVFMCAGVVAANAPDVDLLYTSLMAEQPLGYLLHHRGHSHTLPGLAALGMLIGSCLLLPRVRRAVDGTERRWILLIAAALLSHLLMDTANGYGTHILYPVSSRWVFGDAVFVLEPWLWAILGAFLAVSAVHRWRVLVVLVTLVPIGAVVYAGLLQAGVLAVMLSAAGLAAMMARGWNRRTRAATALVATAGIFLAMAGISRLAKGAARQAVVDFGRGEVLDIVADANPGVPWCWAVLILQKASGGASEGLIARRATLSLAPRAWPAASCASARLARSRQWSDDASSSAAIVWHRQWRIGVEELRALFAGNCRVRAWLQFGRVPYVADGHIVDLRFETPIGQNFTRMIVDAPSRGCPAHLTRWALPRQDVLLADR
jgi:inner membrane protein